MDSALTDRIYTMLAGREGKRDKTLFTMMKRFDTMERLGFSFDKFLSGPEAAQQEGDRFLLAIRELKKQQVEEAKRSGKQMHAKRRKEGRSNYIKNLKALARLQRYSDKDVNWKMSKQAPAQRDVYTLTELRALIRLPFNRTEARRLQRALVMAHVALGWRLDEHAPFEDTDCDPSTHTIFLRHPEKGNPQRRLPIEPEFFGQTRAFAAWLRNRPVLASNPRLVWVYTDRKGVVQPCGPQKLAKFLADAGKEVGVRANCTRGRHTRAAALLAQGKQLAFVRFFMGWTSINTLASYLEMISAGLAEHLRRSTWFVTAQGKESKTA